MAEKPPAFQWYPKDFLTDENVDIMTLEQRGAYITLLSKCWIEGSLPMDQAKLKAMCNHPSNWGEIWEALKSCFVENGEGRLTNPRLDKELKKQEEWRTKSRKGGILSGKARRGKASKGGSNMVKPKGNSSSSVFSLQSSSTVSKKKKKRREYPPEFERLWKVHPKGGKIAALKAFEKLDPDVDAWIEKLLAFKKTKQWRDGYAPHLSTWLNQGQFDGEIENSMGGEEYDEQKRQERATREESQRLEALREASANAAPPAVAREHMNKILGRTE